MSQSSNQASSHKNIIFIYNEKSFVVQAITTNLTERDFTVFPCTLTTEVEAVADKANIILYNLSGLSSAETKMQECLAHICRDAKKILCLIGQDNELAEAKASIGETYITASYLRPIDTRALIEDLAGYADAHLQIERKKRLVLIDDDPEFLRMVSDWLEDRYQVNLASNGKEALDMLRYRTPDLILLDYEMPDLDGLGVLERIREIHALSKVPIIFLTGKDERAIVLKVLGAKPDGYILKSTTKEAFIQTLEEFFVERIMQLVKTNA